MRFAFVFLLILSGASSTLAEDSRPSKFIDLNAPGTLEKVRKQNPAHYKTVQTIINGLTDRTLEEVPRWLRTNFQAKDVLYSSILLTTSPPQRDLAFVLDDTQYRARVTLDRNGAKVYPIRNP